MDARLEKTESALRQEISASASALRQEMSNLNAKMSDMKSELLKWIIGLAIAQATLVIGLIGVVIGLLKFFPINS